MKTMTLTTVTIHPRAAAAVLNSIPKNGRGRDDYAHARLRFGDNGYTLASIGVEPVNDTSRWQYNRETVAVSVGDGAPGCPVVVLPRQVVADVAKAKAPVNILVDDGSVIIDGAKYPRVSTFIPAIDPGAETGGMDTTLAVWSTVADSVAVASDQESSRYALGSVLIEPTDDGFFAVATDGRRLHKYEGPTVDGPARGAAALIPAPHLERFVTAAGKLYAPKKTAGRSFVRCEWSENVVTWSIPGDYFALTVTTAQTRGRFPRWRDVFPWRPEASRHVVTDVADLSRLVKAAARCTHEQSKGVTFKDGNLTATGADGVSFNSPCDMGGHDFTLDPRFLLDALAACEDTAEVEATDYQSCVVIRSGRMETAVMPLGR